jgi:uncharacterized membrane protein YphA (DoxX/SURF4 family)
MVVTLIFLTAITFIIYGFLCLGTDHMKIEFNRYGLSKFRKLTGTLELLGGIGLIVGSLYAPILYLSSAGLALLMFLGVMIRLKTKDPLIEIVPAFILMVINLTILLKSI